MSDITCFYLYARLCLRLFGYRPIFLSTGGLFRVFVALAIVSYLFHVCPFHVCLADSTHRHRHVTGPSNRHDAAITDRNQMMAFIRASYTLCRQMIDEPRNTVTLKARPRIASSRNVTV